jgi:hypothetical protein
LQSTHGITAWSAKTIVQEIQTLTTRSANIALESTQSHEAEKIILDPSYSN